MKYIITIFVLMATTMVEAAPQRNRLRAIYLDLQPGTYTNGISRGWFSLCAAFFLPYELTKPEHLPGLLLFKIPFRNNNYTEQDFKGLTLTTFVAQLPELRR